MKYRLFYWPGIQGRGEYVRLALEEGGADWVDVCRLSAQEGGGVDAMLRLMDGAGIARPSFAPPFLQAGRQLIGQTVPMHCDVVVANSGDRIEGIGGNVFNAVSKTIRPARNGYLTPGGGLLLVVENRYPAPGS